MSGGVAEYAWSHRQQRQALLAQLARAPGSMYCPRCGMPLFPWQRLHLDHDETDPSRRRYLGLSHASCNTRAGQRLTAALQRRRAAMVRARRGL